MDYRPLGNTGLQISAIGLGTMTWGEQNTEAQAFQQMDYALAQGVNFIDTAELYPVPARKETYARTESIIGHWLQRTGQRDKIVLASKIAGPGRDYIRGGSKFIKAHLIDALEHSLARLNTDCIDLYQLHWPERNTNFFGRLNYQAQEDSFTAFEDILEVLSDCIQQGKIRAIGVSNETPWGIMKYLGLAEFKQLPKMASIQNPYNLLNRTYEIGLAEVSHRESIGLLAYSPAAFGVLSGKYLNHQRPPKARVTLYPFFDRYSNAYVQEATQSYLKLAQSIGCTPTQLAISFVTSRSFTASALIGATTMDQLEENLKSSEVKLTEETLTKIEEIHQRHPFPCP